MHLKLPLLTAVLAGLAYASPVVQKENGPPHEGSPTHSGGGPSTTHKVLHPNDGAIVELVNEDNNCQVHFTNMFGEKCNGQLKEPLGPIMDGKCHGKKTSRGGEMPFAQTEAVFKDCKSRSVGYVFQDGHMAGYKPGSLEYYTPEDGSGDYIPLGLVPGNKLKFDGKEWVKA
ncbi:hypothetical protein NUU61_002957 [Penicillium alfredii]|uniref:Uncharacterized protein n=1 Tax=Penicillium alfredii TaxID=1506179 RepID=A0A9W9FSJ4_9EURO|nr:uncharacterized protein NUU61_002957 [Penicillium alfredii]KAJ5105610.1 hypothetical protein NUU61_002957 [Penicillium alfredii]